LRNSLINQQNICKAKNKLRFFDNTFWSNSRVLMRKIILNVAVSLDGLIEGPNGEFDWCFSDQDYGMTDFLNGIDTIFIGRKSYEVLIKMDPNSFQDKDRFVFSKSLKDVEGGFKLINSPIEEFVRNSTAKKGKDIWLFGGANLLTGFLQANLVDELQLAVHPIVLGSGKPLFENINGRIHFKLIDSKTYSSGLVQLYYEKNSQ
jgi:dihydrofolate reductase